MTQQQRQDAARASPPRQREPPVLTQYRNQYNMYRVDWRDLYQDAKAVATAAEEEKVALSKKAAEQQRRIQAFEAERLRLAVGETQPAWVVSQLDHFCSHAIESGDCPES